MESRTLKIILHSAKDLHDVKHFGTMDPYAMLWVAEGGGGGGVVSEQFKTNVAKKAGPCPVWDCPMQFQLSSMNNSYILFCEIKHDGKLLDRTIGEVQVPFTDLLTGDASKQKVCYPVKTPSGEVKGEIILSYKFLDGKVRRPKKKVQGKKKHGLIKKIAKTVCTEAALLVGGLGAAVDGEYIINEIDDEHENEDEADGIEDEDDGNEDDDQDKDEDEDEDEY